MTWTASNGKFYRWSGWLFLVGLVTWSRAAPNSTPDAHNIVMRQLSRALNQSVTLSELSTPSTGSHRSDTTPGRRYNPSPQRRVRRVAQGDRESLPGQDPRCDGFVQSVEVMQPPDPSVMTDFFGVSTTAQKRVKEFQFQTPNWPNPFPFEIDCIKIISAPTKNHRILLNFRGVFELEPEPNCLGDFLEVRDGAFGFSPLLGRFCSRRVPNVGNGIQTTGQYMWLRFRSDSTIPHRGFQAVYRFYETSSDGPADHVFRFRHRMDMQAGETWKLDQNFLLGNLHDYSQDLRHLPIEAAFDVRAPNGTNIVIIVNRIKVPQAFSWTCSPEQLLAENPRFRCLKKSTLLFGPTTEDRRLPSKSNLRLNKIALQDPTSIIDGRHTRFEVYDKWSISAYSPPCPKVRQFCDETVGLPDLEKSQEWQRNFHFKHSRAVIRIVLPSILEEPPKLNLTRRRRAASTGGETYAKLRPRRQVALPYLEQMPEFEFQVTVLRRTLTSGSSRCDEDWVPCDSDTCIPQKFWCDKVMNCPQKQDEGQHCIVMALDPDAIGPDGRRLADQGKSSYELRKEQEAQEAATARLAAQKLHLSILGSLGLILAIVTVTCVVMAVRRRKKEKRRSQAAKSNDPSLPPVQQSIKESKSAKLNHVMSTGTLPDKSARANRTRDRGAANSRPSRPIFTLAKSDSTTEPVPSDETKLDYQAETGGWNSTDSVNAPLLLWHKHTAGGKPPTNHHHHPRMHQQEPTSQWSPTMPNNMDHVVSRDVETPRSGRSPLKQSGRLGPHTRVSAAITPATSASHMHSTRPALSGMTSSVVVANSFGSPVGTNIWSKPGATRTPVAASYPFKVTDAPRKVAGSSRDAGHWISGARPVASHPVDSIDPLTSDSMQPARKLVSSDNRSTGKANPVWVESRVHQQRSIDRPHIPSCRLIGRTQSWGGGLRLAGTVPFCNGQWEVTHEPDEYESPDLPISPNVGSLFPKKLTTPVHVRPIDSSRTREAGPIYRCQGTESPGFSQIIHRKCMHVSMPNVNGVFSGGSTTIWEDSPSVRLTTVPTKRDFKPPSAKRPRISPSRPESRNMGQWIALNYGTDTDEDFSAGTIMLDECDSLPSGTMQQASSSSSHTTSHAMVNEPSGLRLLKPDSNARMTVQSVAPFPAIGSPRRTAYSPNGTKALGLLDATRMRSASEGSTNEESIEHTNDVSENEDMYHNFNAPSQNDYSSGSEVSSSPPHVLLPTDSDYPADSITPVQYRPIVRRIGSGSYADAAGLKICQPASRGSRMTPVDSNEVVGSAYVYEYEA